MSRLCGLWYGQEKGVYGRWRKEWRGCDKPQSERRLPVPWTGHPAPRRCSAAPKTQPKGTGPAKRATGKRERCRKMYDASWEVRRSCLTTQAQRRLPAEWTWSAGETPSLVTVRCNALLGSGVLLFIRFKQGKKQCESLLLGRGTLPDKAEPTMTARRVMQAKMLGDKLIEVGRHQLGGDVGQGFRVSTTFCAEGQASGEGNERGERIPMLQPEHGWMPLHVLEKLIHAVGALLEPNASKLSDRDWRRRAWNARKSRPPASVR